MRHKSTWRKQLAAAAVLPIVAIAPTSPAHAQDETFDDPSTAAAAWLAAQADGPSWEDIGVGGTIDAAIGLMAAGVGGDQVQATLEWLNDPDVLASYIYQPDPETDEPVLAPGAAGKVMYVVATAGGDPTDFGGVRLFEEVSAAPLDGVAPDSIAWAALGLARTEDGVTDEVTEALLTAQCDDGGFTYDDFDGGDCTGSPDTTGAVASALAAIGPDASEAYEAALTWLEDNQGEAGDFNANANSTAMASQALLASGARPEAAEASLAYLIGLQIGCGDESAGAIRFSEDDDGSDPLSLQFATTQALVALSGQNLAELDASALEAETPSVACGGESDQAAEADSADDGEDADEDGIPWLPWVIVAAAVVVVAGIAFVIARSRGGRTETGASSDGAEDEE